MSPSQLIALLRIPRLVEPKALGSSGLGCLSQEEMAWTDQIPDDTKTRKSAAPTSLNRNVLKIKGLTLVKYPLTSFIGKPQGAHGVVSAGRTANGGMWFAIKSQNIFRQLEDGHIYDFTSMIAREIEVATIMQQAVVVDQTQTNFQIRQFSPTHKTERHHFAMEFAHGRELYYYTHPYIFLHPSTWTSILLQTVYAVARVHYKDTLHLDLKPSNIFYDEMTNRATVIDFGSAEKVNETFTVFTHPRGTYEYLDHESLRHVKEDKKMLCGVFMDVFALGKILTEIAFPANKIDDDRLPYPEIRDRVTQFLKRMQHPKHAQRPDMKEIIDFFQTTHCDTVAASQPLNVKVVNLSLYKNELNDPIFKEKFYDYLKTNFHHVFLVDTAAEEIHYYVKLIHEFERADINLISLPLIKLQSSVHIERIVAETLLEFDIMFRDCILNTSIFELNPAPSRFRTPQPHPSEPSFVTSLGIFNGASSFSKRVEGDRCQALPNSPQPGQ